MCISLLTIACIPEGQKTSQNSGKETVEQKRNIASSYARGFEQYSMTALTNVMKAASDQGVNINDVWDNGVIAGVSENGLIDLSSFAANVGAIGDKMQAAYCDGNILSWFKSGTSTQASGIDVSYSLPDLKGLGGGGYGEITRQLSKQMGSNSYGLFDGENLKTSSNVNIGLDCPAKRYIPKGSPVIFQAVSGAVNNGHDGTVYEYENIPCAGDDTGFKRIKKTYDISYDKNGVEIDKELIGEVDFIDTCRADSGVSFVKVSSMPTVNVLDFSAEGLAYQKPVVCFEATEQVEGTDVVNSQDVNSESVSSENQFTNCASISTSTMSELTYELACEASPSGSDTTSRACPAPWAGTAQYVRPQYNCRVYEIVDGERTFIKNALKTGVWERTSISCERTENRTFACPHGRSGGAYYSRLNTVTNPADPLTPTDPNWNYNSNTCDNSADIRPGHVDLFVGRHNNSSTIPLTIPGTYTGIDLPVNTTESLCGSGSLATAFRDLSCPSGYSGGIVEEASFTCSASNTGSWEAFTETSNSCVCSYSWGTRETLMTGSSKSACENYARNLPSCSTAPNGSSTECFESLDENTCSVDGRYIQACSGFCTVGHIETQTDTQVCEAGYNGTRDRTRTRECNGDGSAYGSWSSYGNWDEARCVEDVAVQCTYAGTDYNIGSVASRDGGTCPTGETGTITEEATCQSDGTFDSWAEASNTCSATCVPSEIGSYEVEIYAYEGSDEDGSSYDEYQWTEYDVRANLGGYEVVRTLYLESDYNANANVNDRSSGDSTEVVLYTIGNANSYTISTLVEDNSYNFECDSESGGGEDSGYTTQTCTQEDEREVHTITFSTECALDTVVQCTYAGTNYSVGSIASRDGGACPAGDAGTITQEATCQSDGTFSSWSESSNTCTSDAVECTIEKHASSGGTRGTTDGCRVTCSALGKHSVRTNDGRECESNGETKNFPGVPTSLDWDDKSLRCYATGQKKDDDRTDKVSHCYCSTDATCGGGAPSGGSSGGGGGGGGSTGGGRQVQK